MTTVHVRVTDTTTGTPAAGLEVELTDSAGRTLTDCTGADGRLALGEGLASGRHELRFLTGPWFAGTDREAFHPEVVVSFAVAPDDDAVEVVLALGTFGYTTYRGAR